MTLRFSDLLLEQWRSGRGKPHNQWYWSFVIAIAVTSALALVNSTGVFQVLEWAILDSFFRFRPAEEIDTRLLIVTIDEPDISALERWPLTDQDLAEILTQLNQYDPAAIGLDIYRNFAVEPGTEALSEVFRTSPHLVGVEKVGHTKVAPPPILAEQGQVAMADLLMDDDGKVRRALLSAKLEGEVKFSLGAFLAIKYLDEQAGITLGPPGKPGEPVALGPASFEQFQLNDGAYVGAETTGYQTLLNFRGPDNAFETLTLTDLLEGNFSGDLIRDRIVIVGSIAPSLNDFLRTPYNQSTVTGTTQSPGALIHAHIASQIVSAVLDGRLLIRVWPDWMEFIWALLWATAGSMTIIIPLQQNRSILTVFSRTSIPIMGLSAGLVIVNGILFFNGLWVPTVLALLSLLFSGVLSLAQHNSKLLQYAYIDGLTCLPNRRYFNQRLADSQDYKEQVSIILCDVDHFKAFNDNYGHPAGDVCLQKVAYAIQQAVRRQDVISRYGGEEFAVILQNTDDDVALEIAERMRSKVQESKIPHDFSGVSKYVSISCGVASRAANDPGPISKLLVASDRALYRAKRAGRNQVFLLRDEDLN